MSDFLLNTSKREKGNSLLVFPESYVVVDLETTGFSPINDEIIEIAAIKVENRIEVSTFSTLLKPSKRINSRITDITGITNQMVQEAPKIEQVIGDFYDYVGDSIIVGHNVNFDINFLYENIQKHLDARLSNDFVDVMRISKKVLTQLSHHRQEDLANYYKVSYEGAHRALVDCSICNKCFIALRDDVINLGIEL